MSADEVLQHLYSMHAKRENYVSEERWKAWSAVIRDYLKEHSNADVDAIERKVVADYGFKVDA